MNEARRQFRLQVIIAFGLVYLLWGSTYLAIGVAVRHIPPALMGALRFVTAGLLMLAWCATSGRSIKVTRQELGRLALVGLLLLSTGNVILGWAETYIPTGLAALLIAITPLWFLILETMSQRGDHISARGRLGIALGIAGVVILLWPKLMQGGSLGRAQLFGGILVLCSSFSWATGSVLSKHLVHDVDPYVASGWEMFISGVVNSAVSLALGDLHRVVWARDSLIAVSYLVIAGSWIGFTAYVWLLRNVPTPKVATYAYVNPIVAVFLGWLVLHERIDGFIVAGSLIVVMSVILITGAKVKKTVKIADELAACETTGD